MKKRMLVTTIALVLVIAVALTTSSLAWFTSSSAVKTSELSFSAAKTSSTNLVVGAANNANVAEYTTTVALPTGDSFKPLQGKPTFTGLLDGDGLYNVGGGNNDLLFPTDPFVTAASVSTTGGYEIGNQTVVFAADTNTDYLASAFNVTEITGAALQNLKAQATVTLPAVEASEGTTHTVSNGTATVAKGYVAYVGTAWLGQGETFATGSTVKFFNVQDIALLASIRIAVCGDNDVLVDGAIKPTFDESKAMFYGFKGVKVGLDIAKGGYVANADGGANNTKYVADAELETPYTFAQATTDYASIEDITFDGENFTFSYTIASVDAGKVATIAFVVWMDGWDESALPGVSQGNIKVGFELTASLAAAA